MNSIILISFLAERAVDKVPNPAWAFAQNLMTKDKLF